MRQQVESFVASQELSHIAAANASADDVVTVLTNVLYTSAPEELTWIGESSAAYRSAVEGHLKAVKEKHAQIDLAAEQNRVALAGLASDLAAEKQKLASLITEQQSQFTAAQTEHATKFATIVSDIQTSFSASQNDRQAKFTTAQTENQKGFSSDQETRVKEFAVAQGERAQTFVALATQYTQELATHAAELQRLRDGAKTATNDALASLRLQYENGATKILETIQTRKDEVEKLVGVIGNLGVTSGYQKVANRAQKAVYFWQFMTVTALAGLVFVAYLIAFRPVSGDALFYQGLSTRIFLSITVGVFAAYAARQAANNMETERKSRKLALELEALGPFIAPLPPEMQNKFRADVGDRSFGIADDDAKIAGERDPVTAADLLPMVKDTLAELVKKVK